MPIRSYLAFSHAGVRQEISLTNLNHEYIHWARNRATYYALRCLATSTQTSYHPLSHAMVVEKYDKSALYQLPASIYLQLVQIQLGHYRLCTIY